MSSKISQLSESSLGTGDSVPISRGGSNYRLNFSGAISSYIEDNSSYDGGGPLSNGKLVRYSSDGHITGKYIAAESGPNYIVLDPVNEPITMVTTNSNVAITVDGGVYQGWAFSEGPSSNTFLSREYLQQTAIPVPGQILNTGAYVYNTGNLSLSDSYNGKIIISNNTVSITYTIASGLSDGFSCQVVQNNTGIVTFTGAAGTSMNSYGGLTQIAGRYGSAGVQWTSANTYILAGNLS